MKNHPQIEMLAVVALVVYGEILRHHSKSKQRKLRKSIQRHGILVPLLVDAKGQIVDGVARYLAARDLGLESVPAIDISHIGENDIRELRIALNRLQEEVTWDKQAVAKELRHLIDVGHELDLTGFDTVEIENLLNIGDPEADVETLDKSLAGRPLVSRPGDMWVLYGPSHQHRIACGNALEVALCQKLFGGELASACFEDFPYNLEIAGHVSGTGKHAEFAFASGEMSDAQFVDFLGNSFDMTFRQLKPDGVAFACMDWRHMLHLLKAAEARKLELINICVWCKTNPGMGSFYRSQHEFIALFKRSGEKHRNNIELGRHGRSRSNVWTYRGVNVFGPERHLLDEHPTVKPSAMVADAIRDVTLPGEIVFDPFLGSGSTLIAQSARSAAASELKSNLNMSTSLSGVGRRRLANRQFG